MHKRLLFVLTLMMAGGVSAQSFTAISQSGHILNYSVNAWDTTTVTWTGIVWSEVQSKNLIIPETVMNNGNTKTVIRTSDWMYSGLKNAEIESIMFPSTLKKIGNNFAITCDHLRIVTIPDGLDSIGEFAFGESAIESIYLPDSIKFIGDCAFTHCWNLRTVEVPSNPNLIIGPRGLLPVFSEVSNVY